MISRGRDPVNLVWLKLRWKGENLDCARRTFTEASGQVPAGARVTQRLRDHAGALVGEVGASVSAAAGYGGLPWPSTHQGFTDQADLVFEGPSTRQNPATDLRRRLAHPGWTGRLRPRAVLPLHRHQMGTRHPRRPHPAIHRPAVATTSRSTLLNSYKTSTYSSGCGRVVLWLFGFRIRSTTFCSRGRN